MDTQECLSCLRRGFRNKHPIKSWPCKHDVHDQFALLSPGHQMDDATLGGKFRIRLARYRRDRNINLQLASEVDRKARGKCRTAAAEVHAGCAFLKPLSRAVRAANQHRELYRDSSLSAPFEGGARRAASIHE